MTNNTITQIGFDDNGVGATIFEAPALKAGMYELSATGRNPTRFKLVDGVVTDTFVGTDDEFIAQQAIEEVARATAMASTKRANLKLTPLEFYGMFTAEELEGIYTAAKTNVSAQIYLDQLQVAQDVTLSDPRTQAGLRRLATVGLLTVDRAEAIIRGELPPA